VKQFAMTKSHVKKQLKTAERNTRITYEYLYIIAHLSLTQVGNSSFI